MVNTRHIPSSIDAIIENLSAYLSQLQNHTLTSSSLVKIAESLYWTVMEGRFRDDDSPQTTRLRDVLSDIVMQWECLQGNQYETAHEVQPLEFPQDWIEQWSAQVQHIQHMNTMPEQPKNQPTFHINQVGTVNTGDVTIQGDQIGIQQNGIQDPDFTTALTEIQQLLDKLQQRPHPTTEAEAKTIIEAEFNELEQTQPGKLNLLRRQLLNRDRWFNGGKAALSEVTKHYIEEQVLVKAFIAFLEAFSEADDDI